MANGDEISEARILEPVRRYWGFDRLRPLQAEAIRAGLTRRDSVVVMPTGGGKSLCYQVPPVVADRTDIVVSPLISLMKDQVDGLRACGYPAAAINSGMTGAQRDEAMREILAGRVRLVFVSPERLLMPDFLRLAERIGVRAFAIDEAHCISQWGHDFRREYRRLAELKARFPAASVHAFTATATERVRKDIAAQLELRDPAMLVGTFDRPNLIYRIVPRVDVYDQTADAIRRHKDEAAIVYCLSRNDTDSMADHLTAEGIQARAYHAGLSSDERAATQEAFADESLNVVTATVAFGMGIDRSNVRCIIHATCPKSIEHYQQETGRAGRDGLEAECVMFYSAADVMRWESLIARSAENAEDPEKVIAAGTALLKEIQRYASVPRCRHRSLSEYFGQEYPKSDCGACDVCLNETEGLEDGTETAQKILSCVARVEQRFGVGHVVDVLLGANTERIRKFGHDQLSTYGLMKDTLRKALMNMVYQLVDQELLARSGAEYPVLVLNDASWAVMRGQRTVRLQETKRQAVKKTRFDRESWEGVDRGLFETLRTLRKAMAQDRGVPPYVIFSDATLRDLARARPTTKGAFLSVYGVGRAKADDMGEAFLACIGQYCEANDVAPDVTDGDRPRTGGRAKGSRASRTERKAFELFAAGRSVAEVGEALARVASTTTKYLAEFIEATRPEHIDAWVPPERYRAIAAAAEEVGTTYLRPIFEHLDGAVPYDDIRLVVTHLATRDAHAERRP